MAALRLPVSFAQAARGPAHSRRVPCECAAGFPAQGGPARRRHEGVDRSCLGDRRVHLGSRCSHGLKCNRCDIIVRFALPALKAQRPWAVLCVGLEEQETSDESVRMTLAELCAIVERGLDRIELARHEQRLLSLQRTLLANTLAGIVVVRRRRIVSANVSFARMLGFESPVRGPGTRAH